MAGQILSSRSDPMVNTFATIFDHQAQSMDEMARGAHVVDKASFPLKNC